MNFKNKSKSIMIFSILVIIIFTCFFSIKILLKIKNDMEIENVLLENISNTDWPKEIPIIQSKFLNITKTSGSAWEINIQEYVSYEQFKAYLIELYDYGFAPIKELGSDNPKRLSTNEPTEDGFVLIWSGKSEDYNVEAYWNNNSQSMEGDCVSIFLFKNSSKKLDNELEIKEDENVFSGDSFSGESFNINSISGDDVNSGEYVGEA